MKKQLLIIASLFVALGPLAVPSLAQAVEIHAAVPFAFTVLQKTFPAGEYTLVPAPHQLRISDNKQKLLAVVLVNESPNHLSGTTGRVIFHCYNDRCFLAELEAPMLGNRQLLTSKEEAALARDESPKYFAVLGERRSTVP